jgi:hypothetical protein
MMQTFEAVIDEKGKIHLLESVNLKNIRRAFVTILPDEPNAEENQIDITRLGEILDDDLENARKEISRSFLNAIENSSKELEKN